MSAAISSLPDSSKRFKHTTLNKEAKEIRLIRIVPSFNNEGLIRLVIKHVSLGEGSQIETQSLKKIVDRSSDGYVRNSSDTDRTDLGEPDPFWAHIQTELYRQSSDNDRDFDKVWEGLRTEIARTGSDDGFENVKSGHETRSLDGRLDHLERQSAFTALSYVWGAETPTHDVWIEGCCCHGWFSIRQNLYDFLITRRKAADQPLWIWVDQICIDQSNNAERSQQVGHMSSIYTRASLVEAWLGPSFQGSDQAMDLLVRLSRALNEPSEQEIIRSLPALLKIVDLPYWTRLWVVQELCLSRNAVVRLGDKTMNWRSQFRRAFRGKLVQIIKEGWAAEGLYMLDSLGTIAAVENARSWEHIGRLAERRQCSDVRDKIFGMLSLVAEPLRFPADYTMEPQDLLLSMLRKQLSYALNNENTMFLARLENVAQSWQALLDEHHQDINLKIIRHFLLHEAHPKLRQMRRSYSKNPELVKISMQLPDEFDFIDMLRFGTLSYPCVGVGPACAARIRLWYRFPSKGSIRWRSKWLRHRDISFEERYSAPKDLDINIAVALAKLGVSLITKTVCLCLCKF